MNLILLVDSALRIYFGAIQRSGSNEFENIQAGMSIKTTRKLLTSQQALFCACWKGAA